MVSSLAVPLEIRLERRNGVPELEFLGPLLV
jgi:hypothetical protein